MSGPTDIAGKIKDVTAALAKADAELKWEMAATAADVAGMVDPTPVSDLIGAGLSLRKGDFLGAGLSVASMVPYVGDALAKPVKAVRATKAVIAIEKKIAGLTKTLNGLRKAEKEAQAVEAAAKEAKAASEAAAKATPPKPKEAAEQQHAAAKDGKPKDCEDCSAGGGGKKSATNTIAPSELGELLGKGGNKDVYAYRQNEAVGVLRQGKNPQLITDELKLLHQLDDLGIPTVNARGPVHVGDKAGLVFDKFAQGSKDVVKLESGKIRIVGESPLLNAQSIKDLEGIRNTMVNKNVQINDLQFLISKEGRVVVADPLAVNLNTSPSKNNIRMIDLLIQSARKNGK